MALCAQANGRIRVACVGDSLTRGDGLHERLPFQRIPASELTQRDLPMRERGSYPAMLHHLLGHRRYDVRNFGHGGTTACNFSTGLEFGPPYAMTREFPAALRFRPHVVVLMLGTNDAKDSLNSMCDHEDSTEDGLARLISAFMRAPTPPRILLILTPPPVLGELALGTRSGSLANVQHVVNQVAEAARREYERRGMHVLIAPALPHAPASLFTRDNLHFNANGSALLACSVARTLLPRLASSTPFKDCEPTRQRARSCFDPFCVDESGVYPMAHANEDHKKRQCDEQSGIGAPFVQTGMSCAQPRLRAYAHATCARLRSDHQVVSLPMRHQPPDVKEPETDSLKIQHQSAQVGTEAPVAALLVIVAALIAWQRAFFRRNGGQPPNRSGRYIPM